MAPIIDTHVHLSDRKRWPLPAYGWHQMSPKIDKDFTPDMFKAETKGVDIEGIVFVECMVCDDRKLMVEETQWVCGLDLVKGVVATAPLGGDVAGLLAYLDEVKHDKLKGVRKLIQGQENGFCLTENYVAGCRELAKRGLSADLCIKGNNQLKDVIKLVEMVPETTFILDHLGKPNVTKDGFDKEWADDLVKLAAHPNVYCKISGIITEVQHDSWDKADVLPYIKHAIAAFSYDRVLYGSDWYASKLASDTYTDWFEALTAILDSDLKPTPEERQKLFAGNAKKVYRL